MRYFGVAGERVQMMFNFEVNQHLFLALATADSRGPKKAIQAAKPRPPIPQCGQFLRNHDELDPGRLEESERSRGSGDWLGRLLLHFGARHRCVDHAL